MQVVVRDNTEFECIYGVATFDEKEINIEKLQNELYALKENLDEEAIDWTVSDLFKVIKNKYKSVNFQILGVFDFLEI